MSTKTSYKRLSKAEYNAADGGRKYLLYLMYQSRYMAEHLEGRKASAVAFNILNKWCDERSEFKKPMNYLTKAEMGRVKPVFEKVVTDSWEALRELDY